jgi:(1->4)-alpha-D-glucan 1-alpha-D-glucosylmutase
MADQSFCASVAKFVADLLGPGRINSLAQCLLKLTSPGIPDIYQGSELWDLRLVDPDNRSPVDFTFRAELLAELAHETPANILARMDEGMPKLWLIQQLLQYRRAQPAVFEHGNYEPLTAVGSKSENIVAYMRGTAFICLAPRLVMNLAGEWKDTSIDLPSGNWQNLLSGERFSGGANSIAALLRRFPVAALVRSE